MAIKKFSILSILILLFSFTSYSKEEIRNSCETNLKSRAKDPKALNKVCDCIAKSTGLTEYNGFASLNDLLKKYDGLDSFFESGDTLINSGKTGKELEELQLEFLKSSEDIELARQNFVNASKENAKVLEALLNCDIQVGLKKLNENKK